MTEKYINIDLDDPRSEKIAEVISNKTSKKILNLLAEREMSASEVSNELKVPINTITYNLDKLLDSGLIEKTKGFLWSTRGKKIEKYKIANKKILISPKKMVRGIIPAIIGVGLFSFILKVFSSNQSIASNNYVQSSGLEKVASSSDAMVTQIANPSNIISNCSSLSGETWAWFLLGALVAILIYLIFNSIERRFK